MSRMTNKMRMLKLLKPAPSGLVGAAVGATGMGSPHEELSGKERAQRALYTGVGSQAGGIGGAVLGTAAGMGGMFYSASKNPSVRLDATKISPKYMAMIGLPMLLGGVAGSYLGGRAGMRSADASIGRQRESVKRASAALFGGHT